MSEKMYQQIKYLRQLIHLIKEEFPEMSKNEDTLVKVLEVIHHPMALTRMNFSSSEEDL